MWVEVSSSTQAHEIVASAAIRAGLSGPIGPHGCRATFAVSAYKMTKDLLLVQSLLGHADPLTTARYVRWGRTDELNDLVLRLGNSAEVNEPAARLYPAITPCSSQA